MKNSLSPLTPEEFVDILTTEQHPMPVDYEAFFKPYINQAINYAVGPYCWFIPDNKQMKIIAASDNIHQLTPFRKENWMGKDPAFLASNIHPDDCEYVLSAMVACARITESMEQEKLKNVRINIYGRMINANKTYRWTLIQFTAQYFNKNGRIESCLCVMTDISHLITNADYAVPLMTVIDNTNTANQYFKVVPNSNKMFSLNLPRITKREQEILQLMARGLNTPEIAKQLFLSYHTVEKHKKNLREKTNTKTSAELINFVCKNNMF